MTPRVLGVIPARGGSKGLPRKNLRPLLDKPLVAWTIEHALQSRSLSRVVVSTDDPEIAAEARARGAPPPFIRPGELAEDETPMIDVLLHALDWFEARGETFDVLALMEPTSPLRKAGDVDAAIEVLSRESATADSLVSVGEIHLENPHLAKRIEGGFVRPYVTEHAATFTRRQELPTAFFPYGVVYLSKVASLRERKTFYHDRTVPYLLERWQNYEVDDLLDLHVVETILRHRLGGKT